MNRADYRRWQGYTSTTEIGKRIDKLLMERDWSYKYLSEQSGIPLSTLYSIRSRTDSPRYSTLKEIADYFDVSVDWLKKGTDEMYELTKNEHIPLEQVIRDIHDNVYREGYQKGYADSKTEYESADIPLIHGKAELEEHDKQIIKDFAEWLPKHFDLRFSNNPNVWVDEYFNHTSEKVLLQLKEKLDER